MIENGQPEGVRFQDGLHGAQPQLQKNGGPGQGDGQGRDKTIEVLVNERPVNVEDRVLTGAEIKQAAIEQGVSIELDFVLSLEIGQRRTQVVGDGDTIRVHHHSRFIAVAPDDNS